VLIVDDQASFRRAARAVVEVTDGFEVAGEAASGEASIEAAGSLCPDLVLMDVRLPGIDGREASRRIRNLGRHGAGPIIVLLSTEDAGAPDGWAAECGAAAYVPKSEFGADRLRDVWASATGSS
jgi:DNA-binding NarL/FixJ family response regulator